MSRKVLWPILFLAALSFVALNAWAYTSQQASQGKELYAKYCASCHGADAKGGTVPKEYGKFAGKKVPALAGPGGLPKMKDAGQVYQFAKEKMPADKPGSLKNEEYLNIVAFALQANGINPDNQPLTPESAKKIKLGDNKK